MYTYNLTIFILLSSSYLLAALDYPGTETRPILSEQEASRYTVDNYFNGWEPEEIVIPDEPDYVVEEGQSIQVVVNEAIKNGKSGVRTYIKIEPGHYMETVYVKSDNPITIYGGSENFEDIHIMVNLSAQASVSDYKNIVNPDGKRYQEGDPAWDLYNLCASRNDTTGICAMVFWIVSDNFHLHGLTVHNSATDAQALAVRTEADKVQLKNNRFRSYQDTLALGVSEVDIQRVLVQNCIVEGQVDYVYGGAAVVFDQVTFNTVAIKESISLIIFAPDTDPNKSYGFLVINSNITGDASYLGSNRVKLGRSWDHGIANADLYVPGVSPNGQLVIRDSYIDNVINISAPYSSAATSRRPFTTDISPDRDLDDSTHNRLWEYNNNGGGV